MEGECQTCHATRDWSNIARSSFERTFRHDARRFTLVGVHPTLECRACHASAESTAEGIRLLFAASERTRTYPRPAAGDCLDCHLDYHDEVFASTSGGASCRRCHTEDAWVPTTYDLVRHNAGETFDLTGAHLATPCQACHLGDGADPEALRFRMPHESCRDCHEDDDPHGMQFAGRACSDCHDTETFRITSFDHDMTRYPLDGRHRDVSCDGCHFPSDAGDREMTVYRPLGMRCEDCHGGGS